MVNQHPNSTAQEQHVNEILAAYLKAVEAGEKPDHQQWLARYPELAGETGVVLRRPGPIRPPGSTVAGRAAAALPGRGDSGTCGHRDHRLPAANGDPPVWRL